MLMMGVWTIKPECVEEVRDAIKSLLEAKPTGQAAATFKSIGRWVVPGERKMISIFDAENFSEVEATWIEMSKYTES